MLPVGRTSPPGLGARAGEAWKTTRIPGAPALPAVPRERGSCLSTLALPASDQALRCSSMAGRTAFKGKSEIAGEVVVAESGAVPARMELPVPRVGAKEPAKARKIAEEFR